VKVLSVRTTKLVFLIEIAPPLIAWLFKKFELATATSKLVYPEKGYKLLIAAPNFPDKFIKLHFSICTLEPHYIHIADANYLKLL